MLTLMMAMMLIVHWIFSFADDNNGYILGTVVHLTDGMMSIDAITFLNSANSGRFPIQFQIAFRSVVWPMTPLAAFLLVSAPRQSTPKKTAEPIPERVV